MPYKSREKHNEVNRESYAKHKEKRKETKKLYLANFPEVRKETVRKSYIKRRDKITSTKLFSNYGITLDDYNEMLESQNGCCKCCGKHYLEQNRALAVDHVHGMEGDPEGVRGLLCINCNSGIGKLGDSIEGLEAALQYLKDYANRK